MQCHCPKCASKPDLNKKLMNYWERKPCEVNLQNIQLKTIGRLSTLCKAVILTPLWAINKKKCLISCLLLASNPSIEANNTEKVRQINSSCQVLMALENLNLVNELIRIK
jgi:hypothetical protein